MERTLDLTNESDSVDRDPDWVKHQILNKGALNKAIILDRLRYLESKILTVVHIRNWIQLLESTIFCMRTSDVLISEDTGILGKKKSECSYQESNLRPSDY